MKLDTLSLLLLPSVLYGAQAKPLEAGEDAASAHFSGTLFRPAPRSDADIRTVGYTVRIDLTGATWRPLCCDGATGKALARRLLRSSKGPKATGFERAFTATLQAAGEVVVTRVSESRVDIELPPLRGYRLRPSRVEQVSAQSIPAVALQGGKKVTQLTGATSVVIIVRAVAVHGSFFFKGRRSDDDMREHAHTVVIDLEGDTWTHDVAMRGKQALLRGILHSNAPSTQAGYGHAFGALYAKAVELIRVERMNDQRVSVSLPPLKDYSLPFGAEETISFGKVPGVITQSGLDVTAIDDASSEQGTSVIYADRGATFQGNFYGHHVPQNQVNSGSPPLTVEIELAGATWVDNLHMSFMRRKLLMDALFTPSHDAHPAGRPETCWVRQLHHDNFTQDSIRVVSPRKLSITLPALPRYHAPGAGPERIEALSIPRDLLGKADRDLNRAKFVGDTWAELVQVTDDHAGEL